MIINRLLRVNTAGAVLMTGSIIVFWCHRIFDFRLDSFYVRFPKLNAG
jgi:hypothetical protein